MYPIKAYWSYYWRAQTGRGLSSPFLARFVKEVLNDDRNYYAFSNIEGIRAALLRDERSLQVKDLGAGSRLGLGAERRVKDIAKHALSSAWQGQFLFRLLLFCGAKTKLELGTSLGIGTLYQYAADRRAAMYSIEGCPATAAIAAEQFRYFGASKGIDLSVGAFAEVLPELLPRIGTLDYLYIDGHHQGQAMLDYFEQCLPFLQEDSVVVCDDIYWSDDMQQAWQRLKQHPKVRLSLDLFDLGLLFFRQDKPQAEHLSLIPASRKPWSRV